ncbi:hypothetical protein AHAS_Ahas19G0198400 [Arachis hypogaea]
MSANSNRIRCSFIRTPSGCLIPPLVVLVPPQPHIYALSTTSYHTTTCSTDLHEWCSTLGTA